MFQIFFFFFFQAEDGIRDHCVTGVQTCALPISGAPGKRHALPHARILLHQGSAGIGGTAMDIEIQAKDLRYTRDTVLALVAEDTGQSVETIERDSRRDRWFSAEEARGYGFVDHVVASVDDVAPSGNRPLVGLG